MQTVITAIVALIEQLLPLITNQSNSQLIASIINALEEILPLVIKEVQGLIQPIRNIIAALSANPGTTADQLAKLQALDAQCDADFEQAVTDLG